MRLSLGTVGGQRGIIESMTRLVIEYVPIGSVYQDPANARAHPEENLDQIERSLRAFGQQKPIVVDEDGKIVAGNGTHLVMRDRINAEEIAIVRTSLSEIKAVQYAIADNKTGDSSAWDEDALTATLAALQEKTGDGVYDTGFSKAELEELIGSFDITPGTAPDLASGDRDDIQQMTFIVTDTQAEVLKEAVAAAKGMGDFVDTDNTNSNGNAIARVAEVFLGTRQANQG